ncbi:MAG: MoxR family ATPase [Deltaproteobacteria bacterium]|nr:MoxR family ATPase [Deltaproteobacteria bacterium]
MSESNVDLIRKVREAVLAEASKVIVGQTEAIDGLLVALFARGHALLEGVPGTAKTLMVRTVACSLGLPFGRIQFTPDLMPSDVVGTNIWNPSDRTFRLVKGPIFTELLLADEINRAPAKTQAALLEAMQERQVSIDGQRHPLPDLFSVFATQNPIEQEGTYPLPEAQLDRFLLKIRVDYPTVDEEDDILARAGAGLASGDPEAMGVRAVVGREDLHAARAAGETIVVDEGIRRYVRDLVRATRTTPMVLLGAGPRAGIHLLAAARWSAGLAGRAFVTPEDIHRALAPVVCHRMILAPEVELDGLAAREVVERVAATVEVPR